MGNYLGFSFFGIARMVSLFCIVVPVAHWVYIVFDFLPSCMRVWTLLVVFQVKLMWGVRRVFMSVFYLFCFIFSDVCSNSCM
jgi:hypothetical protein